MRSHALLLVLAAIFIVACQPSEKTASTATPFIGGTNGLLINFAPNAPPSEVIDGDRFPFSAIVTLENTGESDVQANKLEVRLTGLYPPDFGQTGELKKNPAEPILGIKKDSEGNKIPGTVSQVEFENLNYKGRLQGNLQLPIRAEVCYNYETRGSAVYCMRKNLLTTVPGPCKVNEPKTMHNSGAPIQVVSFTESVAGSNTVLFNFKVSLKGNGNVFRGNTNCNPVLQNENRVYVIVDSGLNGLQCQGLQERGSDGRSGFIRLTNGESTFTCTQPNINADAVKELSVKLNYDYLETKTTQLLVKHVD